MIDKTNTKWKHNKTGNIYTVLYSQAIECTNGREDIDYTVYTNGDKIFVRQTNEFYQKFTEVKMSDKKDIFYYAKLYGVIPIYFQPENNEVIPRNWFWEAILWALEPFEPLFVNPDVGFRIDVIHKTITREELRKKGVIK